MSVFSLRLVSYVQLRRHFAEGLPELKKGRDSFALFLSLCPAAVWRSPNISRATCHWTITEEERRHTGEASMETEKKIAATLHTCRVVRMHMFIWSYTTCILLYMYLLEVCVS